MKSRKLLCVAALTLFAAVPAALASTTWYVNGVSRSDSNNCMSALTACWTNRARQLRPAIQSRLPTRPIKRISALTLTRTLSVPAPPQRLLTAEALRQLSQFRARERPCHAFQADHPQRLCRKRGWWGYLQHWGVGAGQQHGDALTRLLLPNCIPPVRSDWIQRLGEQHPH